MEKQIKEGTLTFLPTTAETGLLSAELAIPHGSDVIWICSEYKIARFCFLVSRCLLCTPTRPLLCYFSQRRPPPFPPLMNRAYREASTRTFGFWVDVTLARAWVVITAAVWRDCQVLQQEVERLEARAALVEEEASRAGQLEEEAVARAGQLRALQDKVGVPNIHTAV